MLKAIVWDFDGVIVDSEPLHYRAFLRVAQTFGYSFTYDQYLDTFIGFDDRDSFRVMLGDPTGGSPREDKQRLAKLCADKAVAFEHCVAEGVPTIPGAVELIAEARGKLPMAICSGATRQDIDLILSALGLASCFDVIVSTDDVAQSKPDPACYRLAAQRINLPPGHCLAIEDTAAGITSARDAGMQTLALATTARDRSVLHHAHRLAENLKGITLKQLQAWYAD